MDGNRIIANFRDNALAQADTYQGDEINTWDRGGGGSSPVGQHRYFTNAYENQSVMRHRHSCQE